MSNPNTSIHINKLVTKEGLVDYDGLLKGWLPGLIHREWVGETEASTATK